MPAAIPAVLAVVAGTAATAAVTSIGISALIAGAIGGVVAIGVSMLGGALLSGPLGLNKRRGVPDLSASAQDRKQSVRQPVAPRQIVYGRARVGGTLVYAFSFGDDSRFLGLVSVLAGHPIDAVEEIWINDSAIPAAALDDTGMVTTGPFAGRARVSIHLGTQTAADPRLAAESPDGWSADHRLLGCAYIYVRLEYATEVFGAGLQGIGATVRGKSDVLDPRTGATGWTDNWALCVLDYLRSPLGAACADDEIDTGTFVAAASLSDEAVTIDGIGTQHPRYRADGVITTDATRRDILSRLLTAGAGVLVYVQGRYRLYGGAYTTPTDTLTISDLAGPVRLTSRPPRASQFNAVKGTFVDPKRFWQAAEFPAVTSPIHEAEDGERRWRELELPFTTDARRAQRLARMELLRGREALTIEAPVQYRALRYAAWQMLSVTIPELGLSARPMRILAWRFRPPQGDDVPAIVLRLREESAAAYAWAWFDAMAPQPAPDTTLVSPLSLPAPAGLTMAEELYATRDGAGVRTRALLSWLPAASPFVAGYDVQFRTPGGEWRAAPGAANDPRVVVDDLADGLHEFRVRARSAVAAGPWSAIQARIGLLAAVPPAQVTGVQVQTIGGFAFLTWDRHPDLDVRAGGRIEVRHTPDTVGPTWGGSTSIGQPLPGAATAVTLPLKAGAYLLKAVDQGGRYAEAEAVVRTSQATALAFANLATLTEHPAFSGAKTRTVVSASTLRLDSAGNVDAIADWDAATNIDGLGGIRPDGSYAFSGGMDLGAVKPVRLTGRLVAAAFAALDNVDARSGQVDDWLNWDGLVGGEADAWIEVRDTPDNPGGSPTWSAWRRLDAAEARARGFQFRAQLRSSDMASNISITELSVVAEEVV